MTTIERACIEGGITRRTNGDAVLAEVPSEYHDDIALGPLGTPVLTLWNYACQSVSVDGEVGVPTVVHIAAVRLRSGEYYMLWMATDNVRMFARYRQLGLPVRHIPTSIATVTSSGGVTQVAFEVRGAGLDHTVTFGPVALPEDPVVSEEGVTFVHVGPRGPLALETLIHAAPSVFPVPSPADWRTMATKYENLFFNPVGPNAAGFLVRLDAETKLSLVEAAR